MDPASQELLSAFRTAIKAKISRDLEAEQTLGATLKSTVIPRVVATLKEARRNGLCSDAWLFGSYAWGTPTEHSDIDLLVDDCDDPMLLAAEISRKVDREVHVVARRHAADTLRERVASQGIQL